MRPDRKLLAATVAATLAAAPAAQAVSVDPLIRALYDQGFEDVSVARADDGVTVVATRDAGTRTILIDPDDGEIVADVFRDRELQEEGRVLGRAFRGLDARGVEELKLSRDGDDLVAKAEGDFAERKLVVDRDAAAFLRRDGVDIGRAVHTLHGQGYNEVKFLEDDGTITLKAESPDGGERKIVYDRSTGKILSDAFGVQPGERTVERVALAMNRRGVEELKVQRYGDEVVIKGESQWGERKIVIDARTGEIISDETEHHGGGRDDSPRPDWADHVVANGGPPPWIDEVRANGGPPPFVRERKGDDHPSARWHDKDRDDRRRGRPAHAGRGNDKDRGGPPAHAGKGRGHG